MTIRCGFCHNTFHSPPREAVCPKCKRPANRPLSALNKILCLLVFPFGIIKALMLRASEPLAAIQAMYLSVLGGGLWAAIYFVAAHSSS